MSLKHASLIVFPCFTGERFEFFIIYFGESFLD
ncbi:MAG: hypothetical protein H6Q69_67 [Firmicutes bacterium]|nr:hypothetical protein [Bacillota bacterium]